jgi:hypothetical protein
MMALDAMPAKAEEAASSNNGGGGGGNGGDDGDDNEDRNEAKRRKRREGRAMRRFVEKHKQVARKWQLNLAFPNDAVIQAYLHPAVDDSNEKFEWALPNLAGLRDFCYDKFGWTVAMTDAEVTPVMQKLAERQTQTRIDSFFTQTWTAHKFAKVNS